MKKLIIFSLALLTGTCLLFAQVEEPKSELTQTIKEKSQADKDRIVLELTFDNWLTKPDSIAAKWSSRGVGLYWMLLDLPFGKSSRYSFAIGAGVFASNIYHDAAINETDSMTTLNPYPSSYEYKRNKLVTTYLDIPLEFRYRSKPDKTNNSWKAGLGFKGGMLVASHTKLKAKDVRGDMTVTKINNINHLYKYRYGPTLKIGYSSFNLIVYYSLSTLFEKDKGPEIVPFSVGIMISEF